MAEAGGLLSGGIGGLIGKAIVQLELQTEKYMAELKGSEAATAGSTRKMGGAFQSLGSAGATALAGIGAGLGILALKGVQTFQEVGSEVRTLEKQLGTTAEQASVLRAQGEALGVGVDKLSVGFGILAKHLVANDDVLKQYGIEVTRTSDGSLDFQDILSQLHARFEEIGPSMDRTAMAMNLFGRSGKALVPLLAANDDELRKFAESAQRAGLIMSEEDVTAARELSIAGRELHEAWVGLEVRLGRTVVPMLTDLAGALQGILEVVGPLLPTIMKIGLVFLAWKAFSFLPELLLAIATGLDAIGASATATGILGAAAGLESLGVAAPAAAVGVGALYLSFKILTGSDPTFVPKLAGAIEEMGLKAHATTTPIGELQSGLTEMQAKAGMAAAGIGSVGASSAHAIAPVSNLIQKMRNFADMTDAELRDFKQSVKKSFDSFVFSLDTTSDHIGMTKGQFIEASRAMERRARVLSDAMTEIAKDDTWVPQGYLQFLSTLGPDALIGFSRLSDDQKHHWVDAWKETTAETNHAKQAFNDVSGALDDIDKRHVKGTVEIHYTYTGFDPTKPGMGNANPNAGGPGGTKVLP